MKLFKIYQKYEGHFRVRVQRDGKTIFLGLLFQLRSKKGIKHLDFICTQTGYQSLVLIIPKRMRGQFRRNVDDNNRKSNNH